MSEHDCPIYERDDNGERRVFAVGGEHDWRLVIESSWSVVAAWYCTRCRTIRPIPPSRISRELSTGRDPDAA